MVPPLVAERHGALLFADVSGYTRLSERLAFLGREGAERLTDSINHCFGVLIEEVLTRNGEVLRFGGDALFVLFEGDGAAERGADAALSMQAALTQLPAVTVPGGRVRLRQSIGLHVGSLRTIEHPLAGLVIGSDLSEVLALEALATAGQIALSEAAASELAPAAAERQHDRVLLRRRRVARPGTAAWSAAASEWSSGGEHRLATIGFLELHGTDSMEPTALHHFLDIVADATRRFEVSVLSTDVARDAVKVIITGGVPASRGDDDARVTACMREVTEHIGPATRAGVHTGLVFAGRVGHPSVHTFTVMGDAVNLAARLMGKAEPGEVVVSRIVGDQVRDRFGLAWLEPFRVKGKRFLQEAARVTSVLSRVASDPSASLLGRADELAWVRSAIGQPGEVEVFGPPGIGASRLVDAAIATSTRAIFRVEASFIDRSLGDADVQPAGGLPERFLLVVDGAHHLDERSLATLRVIASDTTLTGGTIVLSGHPESPSVSPPWRAARRLDLGPLPRAAATALVLEAATRALRDVEIERIIDRAGGNPRLLARLSRLEATDDELPMTVEAHVSARLDRLEPEVRHTVRLAAVIGRSGSIALLTTLTGLLEPLVRAQLRSAAELLVLEGHEFRFRDAAVREIAEAGLSVATSRSVHRRCIDLLPPGTSTDVVAEHWWRVGDADQVVHWSTRAALEASAGGASSTAVTWWHRAIVAASAGSYRLDVLPMVDSLIDAAKKGGDIAVADSALASISTGLGGCDRAAVTVRRIDLVSRLGRDRSASALVAAARRRVATCPTLGPALDVQQAWLWFLSGRAIEALRLVSAAADAAHSAGDHRTEAEARSLRAIALHETGSPESTSEGERARRAARRGGDPRLEAVIVGNLAVFADDDGRLAQARTLRAEAEDMYRRLDDRTNLAIAVLNRVLVDVDIGRFDDLDDLDGALRNALATGLSDVALVARAVGARGRVLSGQADQLPALFDAVRAMRDAADVRTLAFHVAAAAEAALVCGADTGDLLTELESLADRAGPAHVAAHLRLCALDEWRRGTRRPDLLLRSAELARTVRNDLETCRSLEAAARIGLDDDMDELRTLEARLGIQSVPLTLRWSPDAATRRYR